MSKMIHEFSGTYAQLLDELRQRYLNTSKNAIPTNSYTGAPNEELDRDITDAETWAAIGHLRTTPAAKPHGVTNKMLRDLDPKSISAVTGLMNEYWREGEPPQSWKHARVTFIPKRNKRLCIENLRPISLTSCLGKLTEHVILSRMQGYAEDS